VGFRREPIVEPGFCLVEYGMNFHTKMIGAENLKPKLLKKAFRYLKTSSTGEKTVLSESSKFPLGI